MSEAFRDSCFFFDCYFGMGMSSLIFQELREFRSFAYAATGYHQSPSPVNWDKGQFPKLQALYTSRQDNKCFKCFGFFIEKYAREAGIYALRNDNRTKLYS